MSDTDAQQPDAAPAQEQQPAAAPEQPGAVPDEAQNPQQYLHVSKRTRDPKDIQRK